MANHLVNETSPYLIQHAHNPVDWYPWNDIALIRAKSENKPILLSIGYSACHWCHVMAHESFENPEIARIMNDNFINIKVDREERPDLDTVYMEAVQSISGNGGWPLTVFLTPEGKPFYGGTYFPPEDKRGLPGFPRVLLAVSSAYQNRRHEVEGAIKQITSSLSLQTSGAGTIETLSEALLDQVFSTLQQSFDPDNGGFGPAPKFPQPAVLEFLLRYHRRTGNRQALNMAVLTLEKMCRGGIYDQIGGGFHRYATDSHWLVPHFEKMLYDNAQLSRVYLQAYLVTGSVLFRRIAEETLDYILREMTSAQGGFYSSQDADTQGSEGQYYLWSMDEIKTALGAEIAEVVTDCYGITEAGNFEGRNILHATRDLKPSEEAIIFQARTKLLELRQNRVRPGIDTKVLTSWNALMLASMSEAAGILGRQDLLKSAEDNASYLLTCLSPEYGLRHVCTETRQGSTGFLEDYALLIEASLKLHQVTLNGRWLKEAIKLSSFMLDEFWDNSNGTFYDTKKSQPALFIRPKSNQDGAIPSGSSSAASALFKLARITGDKSQEGIALESLAGVQEFLPRFPLAFGNWLCALDFHCSPKMEIVICGRNSDPNMEEMKQTLFDTWMPNAVIIAAGKSDGETDVDLDLIKGKTKINGLATAYVCKMNTCLTAVTDAKSLKKLL